MTDLEKIQDQLEKAMNELKGLEVEETQLAYDYIEYANILVKNLIIGGVGISLTSKEAIDYEIYAKRKDKEENLKSWVYSILFTIMFFVGLFAMLKSCSS